MKNPLLETKELRLEYGESAENWVVNKINSLNLPQWKAEVLPNRNDAKKNHIEGDILLKYKLDEHHKILVYIDVKAATDAYDYPVIRTDFSDMNSEKYFKDVKHNFYLGIGRYNKALENNTNAEFPYSLGITKKMIKIMLDNNCEFINKYQKTADDGSHFISMKYFANLNKKYFMPVGKRETMTGVLQVIEDYIKNLFKTKNNG